MMLDVTSVLGTVLVAGFVYIILRLIQQVQTVRRLAKFINKYPGHKQHWFWGNLHQFPGINDAGLAWHRRTTAEFPTSMVFWAGPTLGEVWLRHPTSLKTIFQSSEPKPMFSGVYHYGLSWLGEGLLLSQGAKWSRNRRLLTPAFHFDILKPYMGVNNSCADVLLTKMAEYSGTDKSLEIYDMISRYTFDVILRCAMSYETDVQTKSEKHPYLNSVSALAELWIKRCFTPWQQPDFIYRLCPDGRACKRHCDYVHSVSEEVIHSRQKVLEQSGASKRKYLDFLDVLLQAKDDEGRGLTLNEIRDEVDTFLFEGHDTTASGILWTLYSLAEHGHFQTQCQQEIDIVLADRHTDDIAWEDLTKLPFLTQCLKEALRLHSPVPFVGRQLSKEMVIDGRTLPKHAMIGINIYELHHNPQVWPDSMEYRPSRFDPANVEKMDSFTFAPFSAGPRNCIGQNFAMHEMKTIIARILRRFTLTLDPGFKVEKEATLVVRPKNGLYMRLQARNI